MKKRVLSLILIFTLILSVFPGFGGSALAAPGGVQADGKQSFYLESARLVADNWDDYIGSITMKVGDSYAWFDGERIEIDPGRSTAPIIAEGRTLVPIRFMIEKTGGTVSYDASDGKIAIDADGNRIEMWIDSTTMMVNGKRVNIDAAPRIINGRTMLPLRAVSENLSYEINFQNETQELVITRDFQTMRLLVKAYSETGLYNLGAEKVLSGPDDIYVLQFSSIKEASDACAILERQGNVIYVEPDLYIPPINDISEYAVYASTGGHQSWGVERIGADKYADYLWKSGKTQQVVVAVIDTGADANHPFLSGRVLNEGWNFIGGNSNTFDDHGHGTHVSGTIVDCTSVLDNIKIMPIKVLSASGSGTDLTVGNGIDYAADKYVNVINMSLGGSRSGGYEYIDEKVQKAINKNISVVVAAGNESDNADNHCPAHIREAITVSAFDSGDKAAYFTNYGNPPVDVGAPGVGITSCVPGGGYASWSGTSMASPHVAAAAAMYILNDMNLSPAAVQTLVKKYTDAPTGWNNKYGDGLIDMTKAIPPDSGRSVKITAPANGAAFSAGDQITVNADVVTDIHRFWCGYRKEGDANFTKISESTVNKPVLWDTKGLAGGDYTITYRIDNNETVLASDEVRITLKNGEKPKELTEIKWSANEVNLDLKGKKSETVYLIAVYSDGSEVKAADAGFAVGYTSGSPQVASVSNDGEITALSAGSALIGYSVRFPSTITIPAPLKVMVTGAPPGEDRLVKLDWAPTDTLRLKVGESAGIRLIEIYESGKTRDVTSESGLYSYSPEIAKVSREGIVTGGSAGQTTIYFSKILANSVGIPRPLAITVTSDEPRKKILRLEWSADSVNLSPGGSADVKLYAVYDDGSKLDYTAECGLYVNDTSVASVSGNGRIQARGQGSTYLWFTTAPEPGLDLPRYLTVTVSAASSNTISFVDQSVTLKAGDRYYAYYTVNPDEYLTYPEFTFSDGWNVAHSVGLSADRKYIIIYADKAGRTTLTVNHKGASSELIVNVSADPPTVGTPTASASKSIYRSGECAEIRWNSVYGAEYYMINVVDRNSGRVIINEETTTNTVFYGCLPIGKYQVNVIARKGPYASSYSGDVLFEVTAS